MRKAIVLYTDLWPAIQHLPDQELGQLMRLLFEHQINGAEPDPLHPMFMAFGFIKAQMQSATKSKTAVTLGEDSPASKKRREHFFRDSKYYQNQELFIEDFKKTKAFRLNPDIDIEKLYDDIETSTNAKDKYKYVNWIDAAQNWFKLKPQYYTKRTFHVNPSDNRMAEQIARVVANPINPLTGRPWDDPDTGGSQWPEPFG
jgi:hypothetical protein